MRSYFLYVLFGLEKGASLTGSFSTSCSVAQSFYHFSLRFDIFVNTSACSDCCFVVIIVIDGSILWHGCDFSQFQYISVCVCPMCVVAFNDGYLWVIVLDDNRVSGFVPGACRFCWIKIFTRLHQKRFGQRIILVMLWLILSSWGQSD